MPGRQRGKVSDQRLEPVPAGYQDETAGGAEFTRSAPVNVSWDERGRAQRRLLRRQPPPGADEAAVGRVQAWREVGRGRVVRPLLLLRQVPLAAMRYLGKVLSVPGARLPSLLDSRPLERTLEHWIDLAQAHRNVADGVVDTVAVPARGAPWSTRLLKTSSASSSVNLFSPAPRARRPHARCRGWAGSPTTWPAARPSPSFASPERSASPLAGRSSCCRPTADGRA